MMLDFSIPPRKPRAESIVPMINVVFLLLIFFLMTSRLVAPEPFPTEPPLAGDGGPADAAPVLYVSATGEPGFEDLLGADAVAAFAGRAVDGTVPILRADAGAASADVARLLRALSAAGLTDVALVVQRK